MSIGEIWVQPFTVADVLKARKLLQEAEIPNHDGYVTIELPTYKEPSKP